MSSIVIVLGSLIGGAVGFFIGRSLGRSQEKRETEERLRAAHANAEDIIRAAEEKRQALLLKAQSESDEIIQEAKKKSELLFKQAQKQAESIQTQAQTILNNAEITVQEAIQKAELEVQQEQLKWKTRFEEEMKQQRESLAETEQYLRKKEATLNKREENLDKREVNLDNRLAFLDRRDVELKEAEKQLEEKKREVETQWNESAQKLKEAHAKLIEIAGLTHEEAKQQIIDQILGEARLEAAKKIRQMEEEAREEGEKLAKRIIAIAIQRYSGEYVAERCVSTVVLPNEEMKGRIIGREGRNIRAIEAATGVDLIIDDTPEAVTVSAFDPVRREIGKLVLERLIADTRIHPSRIEQITQKVKKEIDQIIKEAGHQAAFELGLHDLHPEILKMLGRLKYRTSYGQNIWTHSVDVGWLCGLMAAELGLNVKLARRAGLLHDIGKAMDHEMEGSHAINGAEFCHKYGESDLIVNAIASHHNEVQPESVIAHLVAAADALSGARPGARREILESYIKRLKDLEKISKSFEGVEKTYAIQAGREIRVLVNYKKVGDEEALMLSRDIARKIEQELTYPGTIQVTVIRELRAVEMAR